MLRLLIIEDDAALGAALALAVRRGGHLPTLVASGAAGLAAVAREAFAAVVLDIGLPDMSGLAVLEKLRARDETLPVLVVTAHATLDHAISAQKLGATQYLAKPIDLRLFEQTLSALLTTALPVAATPAVSAKPPAESLDSATLIGAAACLQEVFLGIARACAGDMPVLISGPSGSGKTLASHVIHAQGQRAQHPLASLACGPAMDAPTLETQLAAEVSGSVLLEEITLLPPSAQACLAKWLAQPMAKRPRLLATTSADPREAVAQGSLRAELYYAFSSLIIPMPALAERSGDIPLLSAYFLGLRRETTPPPALTPPALAALQAYAWPGNVRELRHALDCAAALCRGAPLMLSHLPAHIAAAAHGVSTSSPPATSELEAALSRWLDQQLHLQPAAQPSYDALLDRIEAVMLSHLLARFEHKPTYLANALGMNRATLRQKLRRVGLQRDAEA